MPATAWIWLGRNLEPELNPGFAHRCRNPSTWNIVCCLPGCILAGSWNGDWSRDSNLGTVLEMYEAADWPSVPAPTSKAFACITIISGISILGWSVFKKSQGNLFVALWTPLGLFLGWDDFFFLYCYGLGVEWTSMMQELGWTVSRSSLLSLFCASK